VKKFGPRGVEVTGRRRVAAEKLIFTTPKKVINKSRMKWACSTQRNNEKKYFGRKI
jgi:hypothetical protein